ncbi:MAG: hypothetical protein LBR74_10565 [Eubacterium sp.]|jgi:hypothetical protein|nr:hypothetical protein [Eubacterium sp.]
MALYSGIKSPCCDKEFSDGDDIVVCPQCGTPHHRDCYAAKGECVNRRLHEIGYIWKSPIENAIRGYIAAEELQRRYIEDREKEVENDERLKSFFEALDRMGLPRDHFEETRKRFDERDIYGVSEREITSFQGISNPLLLVRYRKLVKSKSKVSLNLLAGFLLPFYQFYNRHRTAGILLCFLIFLINIPSVLEFIAVNPVFSNLNALSAINVSLLKNSVILESLPLILFMLCSLFYDYFYLRWMAKRIIEIRSKYSEENLSENYYSELAAKGNPSFLQMLLDSLISSILLAMLFAGMLYVI